MSRHKPAYPAEYRQQLVELVHAGRSCNNVAKEFGVHVTTVAKWVRLSRRSSAAAPAPPRLKVAASMPLDGAERQELVELRRKVRQVQLERDILAKATAWFANNGDKTFTPSTR